MVIDAKHCLFNNYIRVYPHIFPLKGVKIAIGLAKGGPKGQNPKIVNNSSFIVYDMPKIHI